jgi:hypothetical protein
VTMRGYAYRWRSARHSELTLEWVVVTTADGTSPANLSELTSVLNALDFG